MKEYRLLLCIGLAGGCAVAVQAQPVVAVAKTGNVTTVAAEAAARASSNVSRSVVVGAASRVPVVTGATPVVATPRQQTLQISNALNNTVQAPSLRQQLNTQVGESYRELLRTNLRQDAVLDFDFKPEVVAQNKALLRQYTQHFIDLQTQVTAQKPQLLASLGTDVTREAIEFEGLMPASKDVDILYVGEVHFQANVRSEISQFISQLRSIYPDRNIILATEFLHVPAGETAPALIRNREELTPYKAFAEDSYEPVYSALDNGIPVVALEDYRAVRQAVEELRDPEISPAEWSAMRQKAVYNFMTSAYGLQFRNQIWKKRIEALRAQDPSSLVVVWGGDRHVNAYNADALPNVMPAKSFQLLFTTPQAMLHHNAFFNGLYTQPKALTEMKALGEEGKIVHWWMEKTPLSQSLGDVTVLVPYKSTRP